MQIPEWVFEHPKTWALGPFYELELELQHLREIREVTKHALLEFVVNTNGFRKGHELDPDADAQRAKEIRIRRGTTATIHVSQDYPTTNALWVVYVTGRLEGAFNRFLEVWMEKRPTVVDQNEFLNSARRKLGSNASPYRIRREVCKQSGVTGIEQTLSRFGINEATNIKESTRCVLKNLFELRNRIAHYGGHLDEQVLREHNIDPTTWPAYQMITERVTSVEVDGFFQAALIYGRDIRERVARHLDVDKIPFPIDWMSDVSLKS